MLENVCKILVCAIVTCAYENDKIIKGKKNERRQAETDVRNHSNNKALPMKTTTPSEADMVRIKVQMLMRIYGWGVSKAQKYLEERKLEEARTQARNAELAKALWYRLAGVTPEPV